MGEGSVSAASSGSIPSAPISRSCSAPVWGGLRVVHLPGHTLGHIAYHFEEEDIVFCGDTLFSLGCGRAFEAPYAILWSSLVRLAGLPGETQVYCGHEYTEANGRFAITIEPDKRSGQACIRGLRMTVRDVLEYLAAGMTPEEIIADFPDLTLDDVRACLAYAAARQ